jgi:hypothetical protein
MLQFSNNLKMLKHDLPLTYSGLGNVTGTTGRVFPLSPHPISSKSDGYEPTLNMFLSFADLSRNKKTQILPYPFTVYLFTDVQMMQTSNTSTNTATSTGTSANTRLVLVLVLVLVLGSRLFV